MDASIKIIQNRLHHGVVHTYVNLTSPGNWKSEQKNKAAHRGTNQTLSADCFNLNIATTRISILSKHKLFLLRISYIFLHNFILVGHRYPLHKIAIIKTLKFSSKHSE